MKLLIVTPLLVPLTTALLCVLTKSSLRLQQALSLGGSLLFFVCAAALMQGVVDQGAQTLVFGSWPQPFGIAFMIDPLSAMLVLLSALMLVITVVWQFSDADAAYRSSLLHPLLHGLVAGVGAAFVTADLFNLYVWFELSLICALGLLVHGGALRQLDATLKYFVLNVLGTLLLLAAVALLYAATGQLNFAALAPAVAQLQPSVALPLLGLLAMAFLIKAAAFPFFAWLPASYHTLPAPVLALFSALLAKVGVYALIRTLSDVFHPAPALLFDALAWVALLSMVTGVLGAAYHWDLRRILAFHSISQVGYILLAIALASRAGDAAAIYFVAHHSLIKAGLVLTAGLMFRVAGHYDLRRIGGLLSSHPWLGVVFLLLAFALVGIPPTTGFWGKYLIVRSAIVQEEYLWAAVALGVGGLTLYSMAKIWMEAFWKPHPIPGWQASPTIHAGPAMIGVGTLTALTLWMGVFPETVIGYAYAAAAALHGGSP